VYRTIEVIDITNLITALKVVPARADSADFAKSP
jgi:hypothetical protein